MKTENEFLYYSKLNPICDVIEQFLVLTDLLLGPIHVRILVHQPGQPHYNIDSHHVSNYKIVFTSAFMAPLVNDLDAQGVTVVGLQR